MFKFNMNENINNKKIIFYIHQFNDNFFIIYIIIKYYYNKHIILNNSININIYK